MCQPLLIIEWCKDCQKIVTACGPQHPETLQTDIKELYALIVAEEKKRKRWRRLLLRQRANEQQIIKWKDHISGLNDCIEFFANNNFDRKCMKCRSTNVVPVELPDGFDKRGPSPIGVTHECGGELIAESTGRIGFSSMPKIIYDINCTILLDERSSNPGDF